MRHLTIVILLLLGACSSANANNELVEMKFSNLNKECSDRNWVLKNKQIPTRLVPASEQAIAEIECGATINK